MGPHGATLSNAPRRYRCSRRSQAHGAPPREHMRSRSHLSATALPPLVQKTAVFLIWLLPCSVIRLPLLPPIHERAHTKKKKCCCGGPFGGACPAQEAKGASRPKVTFHKEVNSKSDPGARPQTKFSEGLWGSLGVSWGAPGGTLASSMNLR